MLRLSRRFLQRPYIVSNRSPVYECVARWALQQCLILLGPEAWKCYGTCAGLAQRVVGLLFQKQIISDPVFADGTEL